LSGLAAGRLTSKALQKRWQQSRQSLLMVRGGVYFTLRRKFVDDLWQIFSQKCRDAGCPVCGFDNDDATRYRWLDHRGLIGRLFSKPAPGSTFHPAGFIMSIIGAIILLFIWLKISGLTKVLNSSSWFELRGKQCLSIPRWP